jgi:hypothetical protein
LDVGLRLLYLRNEACDWIFVPEETLREVVV